MLGLHPICRLDYEHVPIPPGWSPHGNRGSFSSRLNLPMARQLEIGSESFDVQKGPVKILHVQELSSFVFGGRQKLQIEKGHSANG